MRINPTRARKAPRGQESLVEDLAGLERRACGMQQLGQADPTRPGPLAVVIHRPVEGQAGQLCSGD